MRPADLIVARAEVTDIQAQVNLNKTALVSARGDLFKAIGVTGGAFILQSRLDRTIPAADPTKLLEAAIERRPDLSARRAAIAEADAKVRLQESDALGNPTFGSVYELNEDRKNFVGVQIGIPLPLFNRRQGEIQQLRAQQAQALLLMRQTETDIRRDVSTSALRLAETREWAAIYQKQILPDLQKSLDDINRLFSEGQPGVDLLKVVDIRRKLLRAQDGYLDALLANAQALADLALAVGDPALAVGINPDFGSASHKKPLP